MESCCACRCAAVPVGMVLQDAVLSAHWTKRTLHIRTKECSNTSPPTPRQRDPCPTICVYTPSLSNTLSAAKVFEEIKKLIDWGTANPPAGAAVVPATHSNSAGAGAGRSVNSRDSSGSGGAPPTAEPSPLQLTARTGSGVSAIEEPVLSASSPVEVAANGVADDGYETADCGSEHGTSR